MGTISAILAAIKEFLDVANFFKKLFPPKSTEQKIEEGEKKIQTEIDKIRESGRP